jgi:hypothetical protein
MVQSPPCPNCGRPLQRQRETCIYCGYKLSDQERKQVAEVLTEDAVREQTEMAEAMLNMTPGPLIGSRARRIAKVVIVLLSISGIVFLSWLSAWNPLVIVAATALFILPIWQVVRRL